MTPLPPCLLIVTAEVDTAVEDDWNQWYDKVHLPDALRCPGVLSGRRYATAAPTSETREGARTQHERRTYVAVYELASPEAVATAEFTAMRGWSRFAPQVSSRTQVVMALR